MGLKLVVIVLDRKVMDSSVEEIILPTTTGQIGILPSHANLITALELGVFRFREGNKWKALVTTPGTATVRDDVVEVLVSRVEEVQKQDREKDQALFDKNTAALASVQTNQEFKKVVGELKLATVRLLAQEFID